MTVSSAHNYPTAITIFGGTGDLAYTKLIPALFHLYVEHKLPDDFVVIGLSRKEWLHSQYQDYVRDCVLEKKLNYPASVIEAFAQRFLYVTGAFDDVDSYERIKSELLAFDEVLHMCTSKLFYLAVPPQYYEVIFENIHQSHIMSLCNGEASWSRLLVEKPFGRDLATARALEAKLASLFLDTQIYRIDHYLAKDAIENIISLRFMNSIMADSWNSRAIESMCINLFETKDVSNRGSFYDAIGTLRDVGQNHMLQIFSLLTMSASDSPDVTAIRAARAEALLQLESQTLTTLVRGRYVGYESTVGVQAGSETETYFKLGFIGTMSGWEGTRFEFAAGKAMDRQVNEVTITFRPLTTCTCAAESEPHEHRNVLTIQFSPKQTIRLLMWMKKPGFTFELQKEELVLVSETAVDTYSPEAYERVLFDCITGDQTRFVSGPEVEAAWRFITPILESFRTVLLHVYEPGSSGPTEV